MFKRKSKTGKNARGNDNKSTRPKKKSFLRGLFHFISLPWIRRFILVVIIAAILFWQWSRLVSWTGGIRDDVVDLFGWGLILLIIAVFVIVGMIWRRRLSDLAYRWKLHLWNLWLGIIAFFMASWGILALYDMGGSFGKYFIANDKGFVGFLCVIGLVIAGVVLIIPRVCSNLFMKFVEWIIKQLKIQLGRLRWKSTPGKITRPILTPQQSVETTQLVEPIVLKKESLKQAEKLPLEPQSELRQVAQEVWKKYGEAPGLLVIDGWSLPPIDILDNTVEIHFGEGDNVQRAKLIEEALASYGVEGKVVQINAGPTVTQFGVEPGWDRKMKETKERDRDGNIQIKSKEISKTRVKVDRITSLGNDLALALAAPSIRIEAPVPGKS
ncbi:MAG: DNA translocase FtsK, partial [Dehalococcoidales bacterium]|nr:DNA translocase FtsK [Dehalococcoidales bacterium]